MALDDNVLKGLIVTELTTAFGAPDDAAQTAKFAEAIAKAVVSHITSSGVVNAGTFKDSTNAPITGQGTIS